MRQIVKFITLLLFVWLVAELHNESVVENVSVPVTSYDILTTHTNVATMAETLQLPTAQVVRVNENLSQNPIFKNQTLAKASQAKLRCQQKQYTYLLISTSEVAVKRYIYALRRLIC